VREFQTEKVLKPKNAESFRLPSGFPPGTPVDLEIGCGVGWHPIQYAKANPDRFLIAIEHTREKFERFQSRLSRHPELKNILAVHADAVAWTTYCLSPSSISRCFILYPNPNPKAPSKRWFRMPFMSQLLGCLKAGGEITLATNIRDYFEEALAFGAKEWKLRVAEQKEIRELKPLPQIKPRTHFEKKYLERGETCLNVVFRKL
jgi:tRNA (guanine-N7-)-methyltransferase